MLLTPFGALEDKARPHESDTKQVREAHYIFEMARQCGQPMCLTTRDHHLIYIDLDLTYMNIPSNNLVTYQPSSQVEIQTEVNTRGMIEYIDLIQREFTENRTLARFDLQLNREFALEQSLLKDVCNEEIRQVFYERKKDDPDDPFEILQEKYIKLSDVITKYCEESISAEDKEVYKNNYKEIVKSIKKIEKEITNIRDAVLKNYEATILRPGFLDKLHAELSIAMTQAKTLEETEAIKMQQRSLIAQEMYFKKEYLNADNAFVFQALYLLSNEQTRRFIEVFCKSGEDRTGWMRITLLALIAFNEVHGRDPNFRNPEDKALYHKHYLAKAHEVSCSLENTAYNSGARGVQVMKETTTKEKVMAFDRAMAVLAKEVFSRSRLPSHADANKYEPGFQRLPVIEEDRKNRTRKGSIIDHVVETVRNRSGSINLSRNSRTTRSSRGRGSISLSGSISEAWIDEKTKSSPILTKK